MMLRSQATDKSPIVPFSCRLACGSLPRLQIDDLCRQLKSYLRRSLRTLVDQGGRAACFAVVLVLFLSVAMVLEGPTIQKKGFAALLPSSDTTPAHNLLVAPGSPADRPLSSLGPSIPFSKPNSAVRTPLPESYGQSSLAFEANQGQTDSKVKFLSRGVGYALFFTTSEV